MAFSVYIRSLCLSDANTSWKWRNNPKIWKFTGSRPDKVITPQIERAWITDVLARKNEKRFALCLTSTDQYIGNVFLTDITEKEAFIHIFIGEIEFWGKRRALEALCLVGKHAFEDMQLEIIYAEINKANIPSLALSKILGCKFLGEYYNSAKNMTITKWSFTRQSYLDKQHLQFVDADARKSKMNDLPATINEGTLNI